MKISRTLAILSVFYFAFSVSGRAQLLHPLPDGGLLAKPAKTDVASRNAVKQRLDSVLVFYWNDATIDWDKASKTFYTYDAQEKVIIFDVYSWDSDVSDWNLEFKTTYQRGSGGQILVSENQGWNPDSMQILPLSREEYTYNAEGLPILEVIYTWQDPGEWSPILRTQYSYDPQGNETASIQQFYLPVPGVWNNSSRTVSEYVGNLPSVITDYYWDFFAMEWLVSSRTEYEFDNFDRLQTIVYSGWNGTTFTPEYRELYQYDGQGNWVSYIDQEWVNNTWENVSKIDWVFDALNNLREEINFDWESLTNTWEPYSRDAYNFNNLYGLEDLILPVDEFETRYFNHMVTDALSFYYDDNAWVASDSIFLYYTPVMSSGTVTPEPVALQVFPNPAADYVWVTPDAQMQGRALLEVMDSRGLVVRRQTVGGPTRIELGDLPQGWYTCRLVAGGKLSSSRFMVVR